MDPNETATMQALLAQPDSLIASAVAQAKKWNITGYNVDMEAPLMSAGLDSLLAASFVDSLASRAKTEIAPTALFDHPTLDSHTPSLSTGYAQTIHMLQVRSSD